MTTSGPTRSDSRLESVFAEQHRLRNLAYRLLGSLTESEDVVQETYARWFGMTRAEQDAIEAPGAWLTTVASRICLDVLRSSQRRRERYVGEWIPEPLPALEGQAWGLPDESADPADRVTLDESVTMAFLVLLDAMTPAQRVTFVLHDVFRYPFKEIAEVVGRSPAACRQLAAAARRRVRDAAPQQTTSAGHADAVRAFKRAWEARDIEALVASLDPHAVATGDGGGLVNAEPAPIAGAEPIARFLVGRAAVSPDLTLVERLVNGQPGLVARSGGATVAVYAFHVVEDRIDRIWAVLNTEKLAPWQTGWARGGDL